MGFNTLLILNPKHYLLLILAIRLSMFTDLLFIDVIG